MDSDKPVEFAWLMILTVGATTLVWLATTLLTRPESEETLVAFYRRTRPPAGWGPIARLAPDVRVTRDAWASLFDWVCGCVMIYGALFGFGKILLKEYAPGIVMLAVGFAAGAVIYRDLSRRGWATVVE
jgi:hypothetical protein